MSRGGGVMREHPAIVAVTNAHSSRVLLWREEAAAMEELAEFCESSDFLEHDDPQPRDLSRRSGRLMLKARTAKAEEQLSVFLRRGAAQIDIAVSHYGAVRLMLIAPPLVLGRLRDLLTSTTRMKLVREITRDMTDDTTDSIKTLLQNGKA